MFAYQTVTKFENLNPSLEPCHAFAEAIKIAPKLSKDTIIIVNSCGDAKKDRDILKREIGKKLMSKSLITKTFNKAKNENRPALLTYTVAGDNTKKILGNIKINFKIC